MNEDALAALMNERFGMPPTAPPEHRAEPDTPEAFERRQRVLAEIPGDEWPGEEAA